MLCFEYEKVLSFQNPTNDKVHITGLTLNIILNFLIVVLVNCAQI